MRISLALLLAFLAAAPAAGQTSGRPPAAKEPAFSFRPFFLAAGDRLAANQSFDAVIGGRSLRPFWGGGVQVGLRRGYFVEVAVSRFSATGQRVFVSDGRVFPLGIPVTTAITPIEVVGGYRFKGRYLRPYVAAGIGHFSYSEVSSFDQAGDEVALGGAGVIVLGGAEVRLHRWVGLGIDAEYTHVPDVLGTAGVSKAFGEDDLGGTALRVKILIGR
jgi:hypothetical protein